MSKRILLIQGHPDSSKQHFCHALEESYARGAMAAGHEIKRIDVAKLDFPLLRSQDEWENGALPAGIHPAKDTIIGMVGNMDAQAIKKWLDKLEKLGEKGD